MKKPDLRTITISLTLSNSGQSVSVYCDEMRTESTVHAGIAGMTIGELTLDWLALLEAEGDTTIPDDPLRDNEIRHAQWNALRQGRSLSYAQADANLKKLGL